MPIFRYFIFVGGALLALLFAANFALPASPVAQAVATANNEQPVIRIRSDRHLPERVVLDTTQPTIAAPVVNMAAVVAPRQPVQADVLAEMSAKARVRETFAQFTQTVPKADAASAKKTDARPQALAQAPQAQPRRRVARMHPAPQPGRPMMMVAQQPHFGLFDTTW
ncbi:hypothetical protein GWG65_07470 [Bradyrhizobium sp. CSA207]|uniref:hypothetical protein n=1 Tax=Bradyrhizobium sp. CSA207 TaxID=2698826 RepID=UPI0023AF5FBF|nr:hypothetical protein [Bradyrhizobium sp. CSA207]MDE5441294.1 hypothetical protein [Bradyrhizobium sp. CSA207]